MCFHRDTSCRDLMSSLATRLVPRDKSHGSFYIVSIQIGDFNRLLKIKRSYFFFLFYFISLSHFKRLYSTLYATFLDRLT